jgi:two-component system NtrC family sensor kinase
MSNNFYNILHDVSRSSLIDTGDLNAASFLILNAAIDGLGIDRAGIWLLAEDRQSIECQLLIDNHKASDRNPTLTREAYPRYFAALDQERAIVADDAATNVATSEFTEGYLKPRNIGAMLDAPIRHLGQMTGIICCEHRGGIRHWTSEEIAFVSALADLYGRAISAEQRNTYEKQLKSINEQLETKVRERTRWLEDALRNLTHTQAKLIESEKLASVGRMVAGLAHEINTPLGIAVTSASYCESELKKLEKLYNQKELGEEDFKQFLLKFAEGLHLVSHNLNRAANLVHNFKLSGSIQTSAEEEEFELNACIDLIIKSLQPLLKNHQLKCHFASELPIRMNSYPGAIAQVLTNLVTNSINHGFSQMASGEITLHIATHNDLVHLSYSDNGSGIAPDIQDKIFEPFFTTARKTGGSGLGLAIVHNLITQKLKGQISLQPSLGAGASFVITLPLDLTAA